MSDPTHIPHHILASKMIDPREGFRWMNFPRSIIGGYLATMYGPRFIKDAVNHAN